MNENGNGKVCWCCEDTGLITPVAMDIALGIGFIDVAKIRPNDNPACVNPWSTEYCAAVDYPFRCTSRRCISQTVQVHAVNKKTKEPLFDDRGNPVMKLVPRWSLQVGALTPTQCEQLHLARWREVSSQHEQYSDPAAVEQIRKEIKERLAQLVNAKTMPAPPPVNVLPGYEFR